MKKVFVFSLLMFLIVMLASLVYTQGTNVAIGQNASQLQTLEFNGFNWTADNVVDNCTLQDDPDNQQCCSASTDIGNFNYIRVDFDKAYNISTIVIYGRGDTETQTKDFLVHIVNESGVEVLVYDNTCCDYGNGIFTIPVNDTAVLSIVLTRPNNAILTVCEIQAFQTIEDVISSSPGTVTSTTVNTTMNGNPNAAPGMFRHGEGVILLLMNILFLLRNI